MRSFRHSCRALTTAVPRLNRCFSLHELRFLPNLLNKDDQEKVA